MAAQTGIAWTEQARFGPAPSPPRDGDKRQARQRINQQVKRGARPHANELPCVGCGHVWQNGDRRHSYDHHLGYAAEHHNDVEPVCSQCHSDRDSQKAAQTACIHGHEFTDANTLIRPNGTRECRACRRSRKAAVRDAAWWRAYRKRRQERG